MDLSYFLRQRTAIIRLFYDKGRLPFEQLKQDIEDGVSPWQPISFDPEYDDPEPAFLEEWIQAEQTRELVGMLAVSLLSDTLKLYFAEFERDNGISFKDDKARNAHFKQGFVEGYRQILEHIMGDTYSTCPVRFDLIEQVVLARNDIAHNSEFISFNARHNPRTLEKHPNPFFVSDDSQAEPGSLAWGVLKIEVSRENLMAAVDEVEKLADWVQKNDAVVWEWRRRRKLEKKAKRQSFLSP